jgi:hypothetical protein
MRFPFVAAAVAAVLLTLGTSPLGAALASAQEAVGRRVFSDTLVVSEPFVEDELPLPAILHIRRPRAGDKPSALATTVDAEIKKRLIPALELPVGGTWDRLAPEGASQRTGFDNMEIALKYQVLRDEAHEAVA